MEQNNTQPFNREPTYHKVATDLIFASGQYATLAGANNLLQHAADRKVASGILLAGGHQLVPGFSSNGFGAFGVNSAYDWGYKKIAPKIGLGATLTEEGLSVKGLNFKYYTNRAAHEAGNGILGGLNVTTQKAFEGTALSEKASIKKAAQAQAKEYASKIAKESIKEGSVTEFYIAKKTVQNAEFERLEKLALKKAASKTTTEVAEKLAAKSLAKSVLIKAPAKLVGWGIEASLSGPAILLDLGEMALNIRASLLAGKNVQKISDFYNQKQMYYNNPNNSVIYQRGSNIASQNNTELDYLLSIPNSARNSSNTYLDSRKK